MFVKKVLSIFILCAACCHSAYAEPSMQSLQDSIQALQKNMQDLQQMVVSQKQLIHDQNVKISELERSIAAGGNTLAAMPVPALGPAIAGLSQGFNPEIGAVGTVQAKMTESTEDGEGNDTIALKELELSIAQYVDPYSRLDAIIAFNDNLEEQNVDIEEAYYSHWGLPLGFRGQIGKFRAKIGKANLQHLHALDTVDYPLVIRDFFGEEGLASSGARLVHDIPNPWDIPLELSGEVLRGNNGNSFSGISRRPIFNAHAKSFFEITKEQNLELGFTTLFGDENPRRQMLDEEGALVTEDPLPQGQDRYGVQVFGADLTYNWLLSEGRTLKFQNEVYFQSRSNNPHVNKNPWGFYSLIDMRVSPRFSIGTRFDYLEPLDVNGGQDASFGISPYITFWQSEFANFRLQYSRTEPAGDESPDNAVYLAANFLIGAHRHPVQ